MNNLVRRRASEDLAVPIQGENGGKSFPLSGNTLEECRSSPGCTLTSHDTSYSIDSPYSRARNLLCFDTQRALAPALLLGRRETTEADLNGGGISAEE